MNLPRVLAVPTVITLSIAAVGCSVIPIGEVAPTPNIDATVEAKVQLAIRSQPTATPYPTYTPVPTPTMVPIPPTPTPLPTNTASPTFIPFPTYTPTLRPTATPTVRLRVGLRSERGGVAISLYSVETVSRTFVRVDFGIENVSYKRFSFNPSHTSIQTNDGRRYKYDKEAYSEEMKRQPFIMEVNTGDVLRATAGYVIPAGSKVTKFFFERPDNRYPNFSFFTD